MIVRISTEAQYDVPDDVYDELNVLDNRTTEAVGAGDADLFASTFSELLELVRSTGTVLGDDDLHESALILPPPDLTLAEAEHRFTGDGILPD